MLIDWFTVGAQTLNFLILVWLLKRFLYKPVLLAIDEREQRIAAKLADADAKKADAQKERDEFQHKNEDFDKQRADLLSKATDEVNAERQRLLDEVRQAAEALRAKRNDALARELQSLNDEITRRTREEVFAITRKALKDLAAASLEERMTEVFTERVRGLNSDAKAEFARSLKGFSDPAVVRSAFELPSQQRAAIQLALNETLSADIKLRFETAPDVICGIELTANGRKVAWSIAEYIGTLTTSVSDLLKEHSQVDAKPKPETKPDAPGEAR
jgi:F-type H+-transporting ATPase subunit b